MVTLFDTSALVAALFGQHPAHAWATAQRHQAGTLALSAHSLAETYKVLTVHPHLRLPPETARATLEQVAGQVQIVPLNDSDYHAALRRCAEQQLPGSVVFDALVAQAALKADAGALVTLNPKDFRQLGAGVQERVVSP